jgi:hypothetical protein
MKWSLKKQKRASTTHSHAGRKGMHPMRDWMIGLGVAVIVFAGAVTLIAHDFRVQFILPPELNATTTVEVKYSESDVEWYAKRFNEKDAHFNSLRAETRGSVPVVPSRGEAPVGTDSLAPSSTDEYTSPALSP